MIRAKGLSKSFGGVRAVQDISIAVPEKSIFALIGPNGAGKSTLLNLLSGIYQPDAGSLLLEDRTLIGVPAYQRVRLGIARTFQKIRLFKQLTLLDPMPMKKSHFEASHASRITSTPSRTRSGNPW